MADSPITRQEVETAEQRLFLAQRTSDVDTLDELLYDDLTGLDPIGTVVTKEMDLRVHRSGGLVLAEANTELLEVRLLPHAAVTVVRMRARGTLHGDPVAGEFRYLRCWQRIDGALKVIAASYYHFPDAQE